MSRFKYRSFGVWVEVEIVYIATDTRRIFYVLSVSHDSLKLWLQQNTAVQLTLCLFCTYQTKF
jgi:hypothetical protein